MPLQQSFENMEPKDQIEAENEGQAYSPSASATLESDDASLRGEN